MIEKKFRTTVESVFINSKSEFRKGRGTKDHIFTVEKITSRTLMKGKKHTLFREYGKGI